MAKSYYQALFYIPPRFVLKDKVERTFLLVHFNSNAYVDLTNMVILS